MPSKSTGLPDATSGLDDARFAKFDVVALTTAWPEVGLDVGVWGTVLTVLPDLTCEVEFTERDGQPLMMLRVPQDRLELVWADPD